MQERMHRVQVYLSGSWRWIVLAAAVAPRIAGALPAAGTDAPLPDGLAPSRTLQSGAYIRSEFAINVIGGVDTRTQMFHTADQICQARGLGGARLLQGRLEDLAQPVVAQAYFSGARTASYSVAWFLVPNPDDATHCTFRVVAQTTRIFGVFDGSRTTLTTIDSHGTHVKTVPGDMRPPGMEQMRGKPLPPAGGYVKGSADRVAGVPCHHWLLDANGTNLDLCVPDPNTLAPPLDRGALTAHIGAGSVTVVDFQVKELTPTTAIDTAVFDPAAWTTTAR